ncbi:MAG: hypothetical protein WBA93_30510 [Microcoleaceae cyanobacterium]
MIISRKMIRLRILKISEQKGLKLEGLSQRTGIKLGIIILYSSQPIYTYL